jgi:hypothetical protein
MRSILSLVAIASISILGSDALAQQRNLGANAVVLDNGPGNELTIQYTGSGNATLTLSGGNMTAVPTGSAPGQMLRWDNTSLEWEVAPGLTHDGDLNLASGFLILLSGGVNATTGAGDVIDVTATGNNDAVNATVSATGTQNAGQFTISNAANSNHAITATTVGDGAGVHGSSVDGMGVFGESMTQAGVFGRTYIANKAGGQFLGMVDGADAIMLGAGNGGRAIDMFAGSFKASYGTASSGSLSTDRMVVDVNDDGAGTSPAVTLPVGVEDGTIMMITTSDPHGATVNGVSVAPTQAMIWVHTNGSWKYVP